MCTDKSSSSPVGSRWINPPQDYLPNQDANAVSPVVPQLWLHLHVLPAQPLAHYKQNTSVIGQIIQ